MKKIFILLFFIPVFACSQNVPGYAYSNNGIGALRFFSNALNIPAVGTPAFTSNQWVRAGAMVYDSTGGNRGVYIWTGSAWIKLIDSLNISTTIINIGNTDLVSTGTRDFSGAGAYNLNLSAWANINMGAATQILLNTGTKIRLSASNYEIATLPGSHNDADSMMVYNGSTEQIGMRPIPTSGFINPMTEQGELITMNSTPALTKVTANSTSIPKVLRQTSSTFSWDTAVIISTAGDAVDKAVLSDGDGTHFHLGSPASADSIGWVEFKTAVTTNAPINGDSILIISGLAGKQYFVYRNGKYQYEDTLKGIQRDTANGKITFHPPLVTNDSVVIFAYRRTKIYALTLDAPTDTWADLTFTTNTSLLELSHVWTAPTGSNWGQYGLDTKTLIADGKYRFKYTAADGDACIIGFNTSNTSQDFTNYEYGAYLADGGTLYRIVNGTPTSLGITVTSGHYVDLERSGSTVTINTSSDGISWTNRYTFSTTTSATLYININIFAVTGKCYNPQVNF